MAEQIFGDEFVAARSDEGGAEVAAAGMHGDGHIGRAALERRVGQLRVTLWQRLRFIAALLGVGALARIAGHRPGGIVELQITVGIVKGADRRPIDFGDIGEEGVELRIDLFADSRAALPEMQRAWRRDRHFRHDARVRLEKLEVLQHG